MRNSVRQWLESLDLSRYAEVFEANDIDLRALVHVTDADLRDLGVSLGHRRILLAAIADLDTDGTRLGRHQFEGAAIKADAERRQLTVVFCDLVGSTELSRKLDPEEMRDVLRGYQNAVTTAVLRYQGYVAKFLGDGILAYFGWPQAHEDQVERAVRAGLNVVEAVQDLNIDGRHRLQVRVGIDTGQVVVGDLRGDAISDEEAVIGQTPNLAARLQGIAQPGQVLIGATTRSLLGTTFDLHDLGPKELKGFDDPVRAWQVIRASEAVSRFKASRGDRLTDLVGREHELGLLHDRWQLAKGGEGQVVLLSGEAGIGKSRIVQNLRDGIERGSYASLYFQCSPHFSNSAFHPVIQQLRRAARFAGEDESATKLDKLESFLRRVGENVGATAPIFAALLSLPGEGRYGPLDLSPQQFRSKIINTLIEYVLRESRERPVLCVVEDVHWSDPSMLEFIGDIMPRIVDRAVCLLITYRPEFIPPWPDHPHLNQLTFNRLGRNQAAEIVHAVAGPELLGAIVDQIVVRSDGVPLYVEELTKSVLEGVTTKQSPAINHIIPTTLQSSLVARLDRLEEAMEVAQVGAIIGREFPYDLLKSVLGKSDAELSRDLERVVDSGLVIRRGAPPDATYTFKHSLVQDAAYETILVSSRKKVHARIVELLEARAGEGPTERVETLAHHAYCGELWNKAFSYLRRAGLKAMERSALREAAAQFERALVVSADLPETTELLKNAIDLRFELRNALWALGRFEDILRHLGDAERLATQLNDPFRTGWITVFESASLWQLGRSEEALKAASRALEVSKTAGDLSLEVAANFYLGCVNVTTANYPRATALFETIAASLTGDLTRERCGLPFAPAVIARSWLVWVLAERGEFDQGLTHARDAIKLAEGINHPFNLAHIYVDLGYFYEIKGDIDQAVDALEKSYGFMTEWSLTYLSPFIMGFLGHAYALAGRVDEGIGFLQRAQGAYEAIGLGLFRSLVGIQLGEAKLLAGDVDEALSITNQALALARKRGETGHEAYGVRLLGDIAAHPGRRDADTAIGHYKASLDAANRLGMRPLVAQCHFGLAKLYAQIGDREDASRHAEMARSMSRDMGMRFWQEPHASAGGRRSSS